MLVGKSITIDNNISTFSLLHGRALVAKMIDVEALKNIYVTFNDICPRQGKVQYIGGLNVFISFEDSEMAVAILEDAKKSGGQFFYDSSLGRAIVGKRMSWLKVQGIPLQFLTNEVIDAIGGMFGKVVHKANRSEKDHDLSFEYVGVLVGEGKRVSDEIVLNWRNRKFRV
ncbi:hypothetical protein Hanom_Chr12g01139431 [Helianthus anomalus]